MSNYTFDYRYWLPIITSGITSLFALWYAHHRTKKIEDAKAQSQRQLHKYKEQFNKEYAIYTEIWSKTVEMKKLYNILFIVDNKPTFENQARALAINFGDFKIIVEGYRPFYDPFVYEELNVLIRFIDTELDKIEFDTERGRRFIPFEDYQKTAAKATKQLEKNCENVCEAISRTIHYDLI